MNINKENLLIQSFHALGMRKEAAMAAFSMIQTNNQANLMLDWIEKNYQRNPSEDEIIEVAEKMQEETDS